MCLPCLFNCSLRPSTNHKSLATDSAAASPSRIPEGPDLLGMLIGAAVSMISGCPLCLELPTSNLKLNSRFGSVGKTLMPARLFRMGLQSDIDSLGAGRAGSGLGFKLNPVISRSCKQCWSSVWGYNVGGGWKCRVCWVVVAAGESLASLSIVQIRAHLAGRLHARSRMLGRQTIKAPAKILFHGS